jgi:Ras GTPase-activating-like protein IQGAP2/3
LVDIFAIHHLIAHNIGFISPGQDDPLRELIQELGSAKNNESEMVGVSGQEIRLTLNPKLLDLEGNVSNVIYR